MSQWSGGNMLRIERRIQRWEIGDKWRWVEKLNVNDRYGCGCCGTEML